MHFNLTANGLWPHKFCYEFLTNSRMRSQYQFGGCNCNVRSRLFLLHIYLPACNARQMYRCKCVKYCIMQLAVSACSAATSQYSLWHRNIECTLRKHSNGIDSVALRAALKSGFYSCFQRVLILWFYRHLSDCVVSHAPNNTTTT